MNRKVVYLYDSETKKYTGSIWAHESPLEPGVFHEPIHSTNKIPPDFGENEEVVWVDGDWYLQEKPIDVNKEREHILLSLSISDINVLRCYEDGIPIPQDLKDFRTNLRNRLSRLEMMHCKM